MSPIFQIWQAVWSSFTSITDLIMWFIEGIIQLIGLTNASVTLVTSLFYIFPLAVGTLLFGAVAVLILLRILGRS